MQIYKTHADYATFSVKKPPRTFVRSGFRSPAHENAVYFASERIRRISRGAGRRGDARGRPADGVHARHILRASEEARGARVSACRSSRRRR